jgi:hypothetical protein
MSEAIKQPNYEPPWEYSEAHSLPGMCAIVHKQPGVATFRVGVVVTKEAALKMAAAPDLLAALEALWDFEKDVTWPEIRQVEKRKLREIVEAAISKAKGRKES